MNDGKEPYYMEPEESHGAGDAGNPGYWRWSLTCSDGNIVMACGLTKDECCTKTITARDAYENLIRQPPEAQLRKLMAENSSYFRYGVHDTALRLLAEIVLKQI